MSTSVLPCQQPPPNDPCAAILQKIMENIYRDKRLLDNSGTHGLKHRFREQVNGQNGPGTPSWDTHEKEIEKQQRVLEKHLRDYEKNGCGGPPPDAWKWATRPVPMPAEWKAPSPETAKRVAQAAGVTAGVLGAGYIVYRVVRFLPSLAPPLWWSIGPNLAIP